MYTHVMWCGTKAPFTVIHPDNVTRRTGGVYAFVRMRMNIGSDGFPFDWIYVGQTHNLRERIDCHAKDFELQRYRPNRLMVATSDDEDLRLYVERDMIQRFRPLKNVQHNNGGGRLPLTYGLGSLQRSLTPGRSAMAVRPKPTARYGIGSQLLPPNPPHGKNPR